MSDNEASTTNARSSLDPELEATVKAKLMKFIGVEKVTVANLKMYLKLRKERVGGNKQELAERAASVEDPETSDEEQPLAIYMLQGVGDIQDEDDIQAIVE